VPWHMPRCNAGNLPWQLTETLLFLGTPCYTSQNDGGGGDEKCPVTDCVASVTVLEENTHNFCK
jgi:hypothetical protein